MTTAYYAKLRRMLAPVDLTGLAAVSAFGENPAPAKAGAAGETAGDQKPGIARPMTLDECIDTALLNNHSRLASQFAVAMAEAQHSQALAGYWPQVTIRGGYQHMD